MLEFRIASIAVSGTDVSVAKRELGGAADFEVQLENTGSNALTACKIQSLAASGAAPADIDTTTFATLGAGAAKRLVVAGPVEWLQILATCAAGTVLTASVVRRTGET
jgi:hypothetical protein